MNDGGIYMYTATDRVVFERGEEEFNCEQIALEDIDAQVFSEIMRDVDLFVSVASVGNDPDWREYQERPDFYECPGFGELSEADSVRRDVLKAIIPKLKIARQLEVDGRFLIVQGKRTRYKIHLRSTNILMEPNNQYLCVVDGVKAKLPLLPFDDDRALALILSKALLLAADDKIKDQTILSQLPPLPEKK
ncbi:hypothetical protein [Oceanobacter mangrovi]|uniref:DUF7737 domain-containing protein n=1 Tax=Oceanobacter mangrovi TaxID=2862510 RepID=UPI001C8CFB0C|nr:hypothetical protein [Oceanobacter mangrovi]